MPDLQNGNSIDSEQVLERLLLSGHLDGSGEYSRYSDKDIEDIAKTLHAVNQKWSLVPRLYIILRLVGRLDCLDDFLACGRNDYWFPFSPKDLSHLINDASRKEFLKTQKCVLYPEMNFEINSPPRHFHLDEFKNGAYSIGSSLGSGASSHVHEIRGPAKNGESIVHARKLLPRRKRCRDSEMLMNEYLSELDNLKKLHHRHMVLLMGSYTDINNFGIIISPAADTDLATFLNEVPGSTEKQSMLAGFFGCLASAVEYLHAKNIQIRHKDIKPANILIKEDTVLINDFGLARDYSDDDCSTTKGPDVWGTKVYFAPEVADTRPRNTSSDIWSLGCVFLEMMTALKGETVQTLRKLFDNRGRSGCYWQNQWLTTQWISALENEEPIASNEPLKWIRAMLQNDPKSRPKARDLVREIVHHAQRVGPGAGFCQICCLGEKDNDDLEPGTGQDGIQNKSYSPELPYARLRELITDERPPRDAADDSMEIPSSGSTGEMFSPEIDQTSTTDEVAILAKKYGVSIERPDDEASIGKWALFYGILTGDIHPVREAFQREVEVDTPGRVWTREDGSVMTMQTPLLIAAELGHINIVEVLLDHGAQIQVKGGWTALHSAAHSGHVQVVKLLLDRGAAIDACPDDWITALFATVSVDTDFTTVDEAALYAVVKVLLERGSNPRFTIKEPHYTWSILDEAALTGRYNIASLILEYLQLDTDSTLISTALSSAVRYNRADLTELFLESGGDANFRSWNGRTVLHHAAFDGNCQIVKVLLKGNANIDARDDDGITPIEIARREGESQVVDILNDARDKILQN